MESNNASTALTMVLCLLGTPMAAAAPHQDTHAQVSPSVPVTLEGFVLDPDGTPAVGAVVVTSAGGQAVVDPDGSYRMEVEIPPDAERVQVTAVGQGSQGLVGSRSVEVFSGAGQAGAGTLFLEQGGSCSPGWIPTFGSEPGTSGPVFALTVFDDGDGPRLYAACGLFAGGVQVNFIAKWDGASWVPLGSGMGGGVVHALTVFDDGGGKKLYAGGSFNMAGGVEAKRIAKWDGTSWARLGSGLGGGGVHTPTVSALTVFDDGGGEKLYVGGSFTRAGGATANRVAKWDGTTWASLGSGVDSLVFALTVFDDGDGDALYVGGFFFTAGGGPANKIAKWDGTSWAPLGSGMGKGAVEALTVFDDGDGEALYAGGGSFTTAGGVPANRVAKWDGTSWAPLGSGIPGAVQALTVFDDGGGKRLYAGGYFTTAGGVAANRIAKWDGTKWAPLGSGMTDGAPSPGVLALTAFDDGGGKKLYAGGDVVTAGSVPSQIAKWDGASWTPLGSGMNDAVHALAVFDDGGGNELYAAGDFTTAGGIATNKIAKWDGTGWTPLGSGMAFPGSHSCVVFALTVFDDGGGEKLYAAGHFTTAGGVAANKIAKWNGARWEPLGSGVPDEPFNTVSALTVFDDGDGDALYAGGFFATVGGVAANKIAKWDGTSWAPLGSGVNGLVSALTVFDDGDGEALYAGGVFTSAGGGRIAKWDGRTWEALGSGLDHPGPQNTWVKALTVFDDGGGNALYVGGTFLTAGGVRANGIAKWDGTRWAPLGSGMVGGRVEALTVIDDGSGEKLYAGGSFTLAGGMAANGIAKWDGRSWAPLGSGMDAAGCCATVLSLTAFDDGSGNALYAGGFFRAIDSGDSHVAKWGCPQDTTPPVLACPAFVRVTDRVGNGPGEVVHFSVSATDDLDLRPSVVCVPPSGTLFPRGTTLVECTATDASGNRVTCQFPVKVVLSSERQTVY